MLTPQEKSRFDAYLEGEMSDADAADFEDALASDETLLAAFEAYAAAHQKLHPDSDYAPPPQFTDRVRDTIRRRSGGRFFQEDLVITRYIPIFVVAAFVTLLVIALVGRNRATNGVDDTIEIVEQGAADTEDGTAKRRKAGDRSHRRNPSHEDYMKPASEGRDYRDLPVSGGRTPDSVTYTRRVWMLKSPKDEAGLRAEIEEIFGRVSLEEHDDYLRLRIRDNELSGARQRLEMMDGDVRYESQKVPREEASERYIRFYYDGSDDNE